MAASALRADSTLSPTLHFWKTTNESIAFIYNVGHLGQSGRSTRHGLGSVGLVTINWRERDQGDMESERFR